MTEEMILEKLKSAGKRHQRRALEQGYRLSKFIFFGKTGFNGLQNCESRARELIRKWTRPCPTLSLILAQQRWSV